MSTITVTLDQNSIRKVAIYAGTAIFLVLFCWLLVSLSGSHPTTTVRAKHVGSGCTAILRATVQAGTSTQQQANYYYANCL